jgi:hypothetical protein
MANDLSVLFGDERRRRIPIAEILPTPHFR